LIEGLCQILKNKENAIALVDSILEKVDANNNGSIDYSEFIMANMEIEELNNQQQIEMAFKMLDKDNNGIISIEEIKNAFQVQNDENSINAIYEIINDVDNNNDGQVE